MSSLTSFSFVVREHHALMHTHVTETSHQNHNTQNIQTHTHWVVCFHGFRHIAHFMKGPYPAVFGCISTNERTNMNVVYPPPQGTCEVHICCNCAQDSRSATNT